MKNYILAVTVSFICMGYSAIAQVKTSAQEVDTPKLVEQREGLKMLIISSYLAVKNGLVVSDFKKTTVSASEFSAAMGKFKFKKLTAEEMNVAASARISIKELADSIVTALSIDTQRILMKKLSAQLWVIIDKIKPENTPLYLQRCSIMGDSWISGDKKVENPYNPKNMLTCGDVIDEK